MKKMLAMMSAVAAAMAFGGNVCTWTGGSATSPSDWTEAANWESGVKPVAGNGDTVVIPEEKVAVLKASDTASRQLVEEGGLALIKMMGRPGDTLNKRKVVNTGTLVVEVGATDADVTIPCKVLGYRDYEKTSSDASSGLVIKRGTGALRLHPESAGGDYFTSFTAEEGDLYLPQEVTASSNYRTLCVSNNATLHIPATTGKKYQVNVINLEGAGTVTNSHANGYADIQIYVTGDCEFSGKLTNLRLFAKSGNLRLTGEESTMTSMPTADSNKSEGPDGVGVLGVKKFGMKGSPSSVGVGNGVVFGQLGGVIRYIGEEDETTDKCIYWQYPNTQMNFIDGGSHGGLKFSADSAWADWTSSDTYKGMKSLGLCGDGLAGTNEMAGAIAAVVKSGNTCRMHLTKRGAGIWRFRDHETRDGIGGITVEEGALQFDSLAEKGVMCALGMAVDCHTNYWGEYDAGAKVDYAFLLGSENAQGILEYTGNADATCSTRPIALTGKGGKLLNSTDSALHFGGVAPASGASGATTFSLGGNGMGGSVLGSLVDTELAPISVVKEGVGEWALEKGCSFRGKATAAGGRLIARSDRNVKFTWFRLVIRDVVSNAGATETSAALLMKIFLYNANGVRQNVDLTYGSNPLELLPGQAVADYVNTSGAKVADPSLLFTDNVDNNGWKLWPILDPSDETGTKSLKVTMRLAANADEIVAYDLASRYPLSDTNNGGSNVKSYLLQGSADGKDWQDLDSISDTTDEGSPMQIRPYNKRYYSDGMALNATTIVEPRIKDGSPIGPAIVARKIGGRGALDDISGVELKGGELVQEGESVELDALTVDAVAGGTLDNFTFAEEGALDVLNLPKGGSVELPLVFANVPAGEIAKLANWSLTISGEVKSGKSIAIRNGKVYIDSSGLVLIVR